MNRKPAEFFLMFAVIAITAWHVRSFLATKDAEFASWIIGFVLGACCFLFAHRFFSGGRAAVPAFFALCIGAAYSVSMQYSYFDANDIAQDAVIYQTYGWNINALVLALWAPTFEILLGWLYSAMVGEHVAEAGPSRWSAIGDALANRAVAALQPDPQSSVQPDPPTAKSAIAPVAPSAKALQATAMRANGMRPPEIAVKMQISERTVYNLLKSMKPIEPVTNGHSKEAAL